MFAVSLLMALRTVGALVPLMVSQGGGEGKGPGARPAQSQEDLGGGTAEMGLQGAPSPHLRLGHRPRPPAGG